LNIEQVLNRKISKNNAIEKRKRKRDNWLIDWLIEF
jgi:hypothetical protein